MACDPEHIKKLESWQIDREKALDYCYEQFDKLIVLISSGGLVLTIGFVKDIIIVNENTPTFLLKSTWFLLALALIINLLSQISALWANRFEIKITRIEVNELNANREFNSNQVKSLNRFFKIANKLVTVLNTVSFISLIIGILTFVIFINQNF